MRISTNVSQNDLTFLNDSQADICVVKISSIQSQVDIDRSDVIKIKGITDEAIDSFGSISLNLIFNDISISHIFHVVSDAFAIPSDGIIGKDFNRRFQCLIDYSDMTFTIRHNPMNIVVKIFSEPKANVSALPARCESYRIFHIANFNSSCLIPAQELSEGVSIPNTIAHTKDVIVRVLNTNTSMRKINTQIKSVIPLNNFNIFVSEKSTTKNDASRNAY